MFVWDRFTKFEQSLVMQNFGTSFFMVSKLARYLIFWVLRKPSCRCCGESMLYTSGKSSNFNNKLSTQKNLYWQNTKKMTKALRSFGKHSYWPWQKTFLFFNILSVFIASIFIFVQRNKYLRWRDIILSRQNGSANRKSQVGWILTFCVSYLPFMFQILRKKLKYSVNTSIVIALAKIFCLCIKETLTLKQLTWISIGILLLKYCTNTNMLHS